MMATNDAEEEGENVIRNLREEMEDVDLCEGGISMVIEASSNGGLAAVAVTDRGAMTSSYYGGSGGGVAVGMSPLLANVALVDSFHGTVSSGDEPSTDSRMCTEESAERMTSSTEGMVSLSEDSSGHDTYAQAHGVGRLNSLSGASGAAAGNSGPPQHADTIELDESDEQMNGLLGSYREISIEDNEIDDDDGLCDRSALLGEDTEEEVSNLSPDSGPASPSCDNKEMDEDDGEAEDENVRGVFRKGKNTPSFPGSRSSTPSLYKQALTPQLAPIDPTVLNDIETKARTIASSVDTILENLTGTLHSMSSLTVDCMDTYHSAVCKTCDSIDSNIKAMYQLMAKFEELGNLMRPVYRLSGQIKEIKRLLDLLEHVAASGGS